MYYRSFTLDKQESTPLYQQLYAQIKTAIASNKIKNGEKLISKRKLAQYLHISQNTIESAYEQLMAEGYIESQNRRGYFVCYYSDNVHPQTPSAAKHTPMIPANETVRYEVDFNPDLVEADRFPFEIWKKKSKTLLNQGHKHLLTMGENQGDIELREALAHYLHTSRGVNCQPGQIIVAAGIENCLMQLSLLFSHISTDFSYAIEEYGYNTVASLLSSMNKPLQRLPLQNKRHQVDLTTINDANINALYLTPSHQYPYGEVLSINTRQQLLEWVNQAPDRYIIEDDYDSEFRYRGNPIPTLQSLDSNGKVIYLGSLSKLLMPSIRITYIVLPAALMDDYHRVCGFFKSTVSRLDQQLIAKLINEGDFERHINKMRKLYQKKMELLCKALAPFSDNIRYYGEVSGSYLLIELYQEARDIELLIELAKREKIKLYPIRINQNPMFSMGFGHLSETKLPQAMTTLLRCWDYIS